MSSDQNQDKLNQDFIDRQFHSLRALLLSLVEDEIDDYATLDTIKKEIKNITSHVWNKFTAEFGDQESIDRMLQYKNKRRGDLQ